MYRLIKDKLFMVLAILMALTLLSWQMLFSVKLEPKTIGTLLLLLAFVKVQLIISKYMELNKAIVPIRIAFWMWTIVVGGISILMYLK